MHLLQILFFSGLFALAGLLFAWWILARDHRAKMQTLERAMTDKVEERYLAYVDLEQRVTRVIGQFDRCESDFAARLAERNDAIRELERALDTYQGKITAFIPVQRAAPVEENREPARGVGEELRAFEEKLARVQQAKEEEIERQSRTIGELTDRIRQLEPLDQALVDRGAELAETRRASADREEHLRAELASLQVRVTELEPLEEALATSLRRLGGIEAELQRVSSKHEREAREWEGLAHELEERRAGTASELEAQRSRNREQDERNRELAAELAAAHGRCAEIDETLGRTHEVLVAREQEYEDLQQEYASSQEQLVARGLERDARQQELGEAISQAQEREAHWVSVFADLEQRSRSIEVELSQERKGHAATGSRMCELEAEHAARAGALAKEVARLEVRVGELEPLREQLAETRRELGAREQDFQSLQQEFASSQEQLVERGLERDARQQELGEALSRAQEREAHWASALAELEQRSRSIEGELSQERESHAATGSRLREVEAEYAARATALAEEVARLEARVGVLEPLREQLAETRRELGTRTKELRRASTECEDLKSEHETLRREAETLQRDLARREERQRALDVELDAERAHVRAQTERATAAEGLVEEAARSLDQQGRRIADLVAALDGARGEITRKEALVAERESNLDAASSVVDELKPMLDFLERHLKSSQPTR